MLNVSIDDFLWYVDQALDSMIAIVDGLGDDLANTIPRLPGANSPYAMLTHCLGVTEFWGGQMVSGRKIERDREAEFRSSGSVDGLIERAQSARSRLGLDVREVDSIAPPAGDLPPEDKDLPFAKTRGAVLLHVLEELIQHLGHMEITRDLLLADREGLG